MQQVSQELEDLVRICTYAHRAHAGGLVWLSWCGGAAGKACKLKPSHGSTLKGSPDKLCGRAVASLFQPKQIHTPVALETHHLMSRNTDRHTKVSDVSDVSAVSEVSEVSEVIDVSVVM